MNMFLKLSNNLIDKNKKNIFGDEVDIHFNIKNNNKSVDIPEILFNNYFKSRNDSYYDFFKKEVKRIYYGNVNTDEYNFKGFNRTKKVENKIRTIMRKTYGYDYELPLLWRFSKRGNERFQFIVLEQTKEIIIFDLYHLLLPALDKYHNEKIKNPEKKYLRVKNNNYDLANALIDLKEKNYINN